jgi:hypothetical protein
MISFRYPININMFMCCLTYPRYLQDTFKIYQIIFLKDICDLYVCILKIFGRYMVLTSLFFLHIITGNVHPRLPWIWSTKQVRCLAHWLLTIFMEVGVIRTPRKFEQNNWINKFFAFTKSIFINHYGWKNLRKKTNLQFLWIFP